MLHPVNHYILSITIDCFLSRKRADFGFAILGSFFIGWEDPGGSKSVEKEVVQKLCESNENELQAMQKRAYDLVQ